MITIVRLTFASPTLLAWPARSRLIGPTPVSAFVYPITRHSKLLSTWFSNTSKIIRKSEIKKQSKNMCVRRRNRKPCQPRRRTRRCTNEHTNPHQTFRQSTYALGQESTRARRRSCQSPRSHQQQIIEETALLFVVNNDVIYILPLRVLTPECRSPRCSVFRDHRCHGHHNLVAFLDSGPDRAGVGPF
jgi:hypothetical protein